MYRLAVALMAASIAVRVEPAHGKTCRLRKALERWITLPQIHE